MVLHGFFGSEYNVLEEAQAICEAFGVTF